MESWGRPAGQGVSIGTGAWRSVSTKWDFTEHTDFPFDDAFVNGTLSLSPIQLAGDMHDIESIGVFKDSLCACFRNKVRVNSVDVRVMKEYGVAESWTRIHVVASNGNVELPCEPCFEVIKFFDSGEMLLLCNGSLLFYNPRNRSYMKLNNRGIRSIRAIVHKLTFASLKEIVKGDCLCELRNSTEKQSEFNRFISPSSLK